MGMNLNGLQGFSLIELVLTIVIMGIMAAVTAPIFSQGIGISQLTKENLLSLEKLGLSLERIARELREINHTGVNYDLSTLSANQIVFTKNDSLGTQVTIQFDGAGVLSLSYSTPALSATLSDEVSAFTLLYYDQFGNQTTNLSELFAIGIELSLQNPSTNGLYTQRTRVVLRDQS